VRGPLRGLTSSRIAADGTVVHRWDGNADYPISRLEAGFRGRPERPGFKVMIRVHAFGAMGCPNILRPPVLEEEDARPAWLREALRRESDQEERAREEARGPRPPREPELLERVTVRRLARGGEGERQPGVPREAELADLLRQVAEQTDLSLAADYDPGFDDYYDRLWPQSLEKDLERVPVWQALDAIADRWGVDWEWRAGWLRVRSPRAPFALAGEVDLTPPWDPDAPPRWWQRWRPPP